MALNENRNNNEPDRELLLALQQKSQEFAFQHRYASGLRFLFPYREQYPDNEFILRLLATLVYTGNKRSNAQIAGELNEQFTPTLLENPLLDPIFSVCDHCNENYWVSHYYLATSRFVGTSGVNLIGSQCQNCGKRICRSCAESVQTGATTGFSSCPSCGGKLGIDDQKPKGRTTHRSQDTNLPLVYVAIYREGPIDPDITYIKAALRRLCPEVFDSPHQINITGMGIEATQWPRIQQLAPFLVGQKNADWLNPDQYSLNMFRATYDEDDLFIVRVYQKERKQTEIDYSKNSFEENIRINDDLIEQVSHAQSFEELNRLSEELLYLGNYSCGIYFKHQAIQLNAAAMERMGIHPKLQASLDQYAQHGARLENALQLYAQGKRQEAINVLIAELDRAPYWAPLYSSLGYYSILARQWDTAQYYLDIAIRLDPFLKESYNNMGMLKGFTGQKDQAEQYYRRALRIDPNYADALQNLADL